MGVQLAHVSHWREDGTCSYCGSISPELLFAAIEAGHTIEPTDKNYKIYVDLPDLRAGEPYVSCAITFDIDAERVAREKWVPADPEQLKRDGWGSSDYKWMQVWPRPATRHAKFYFDHLSEDEQTRFVELLNAKKLNLAYPGHFYRLPFFVKVVGTIPPNVG
jgi:hypothetical protein